MISESSSTSTIFALKISATEIISPLWDAFARSFTMISSRYTDSPSFKTFISTTSSSFLTCFSIWDKISSSPDATTVILVNLVSVVAKSAKKRILVNETKAARNKAIKSKVKTAVKKVEAAVAAKDAETAKTALRAAIVEISKAGTKGVYHKKTVSRKISRLSKAVSSIA